MKRIQAAIFTLLLIALAACSPAGSALEAEEAGIVYRAPT